MAWTLTGDVAEYLAAAGGFLRSRAAENTVQLRATETIRVRGAAAFGDEAPLFGWWAAAGGPVTAAFLHTPPFGVTLTPSPAGVAAALAETFATVGCHLRDYFDTDPAPPSMASEALKIARSLADDAIAADALSQLCWLSFEHDDVPAALAQIDEAVRLARAAGDTRLIAYVFPVGQYGESSNDF